jgi:hypothetical protein
MTGVIILLLEGCDTLLDLIGRGYVPYKGDETASLLNELRLRLSFYGQI